MASEGGLAFACITAVQICNEVNSEIFHHSKIQYGKAILCCTQDFDIGNGISNCVFCFLRKCSPSIGVRGNLDNFLCVCHEEFKKTWTSAAAALCTFFPSKILA